MHGQQYVELRNAT